MEHLMVVEMEWENGGRFWSPAMSESMVGPFIDTFPPDLYLSDIDCSTKCWCCQTPVVESN